MRKEAYQILKKRLQQLIIDEQENICFITAGQLQEMIESGITPNYAIKHIGLWNRQVEFIESESPFLCRQHLLSLENTMEKPGKRNTGCRTYNRPACSYKCHS